MTCDGVSPAGAERTPNSCDGRFDRATYSDFRSTTWRRTAPRSDLELLFLQICRRHHLPLPEVNAEIGDIEVDFLWRRRRLVVETDSYRYHRGQIAFQRDRNRDLDLQELGFQVVRFSERHLNEEPMRVAQTVRRLLA